MEGRAELTCSGFFCVADSAPNHPMPAPTATIDDIPDEILDEIFGHNQHDRASRASLFVASRVCRRWRNPAQRVLFRRSIVDFFSQNTFLHLRHLDVLGDASQCSKLLPVTPSLQSAKIYAPIRQDLCAY